MLQAAARRKRLSLRDLADRPASPSTPSHGSSADTCRISAPCAASPTGSRSPLEMFLEAGPERLHPGGHRPPSRAQISASPRRPRPASPRWSRRCTAASSASSLTVAVHLRSARTFTPAAALCWPTSSREMQSTLTDQTIGVAHATGVQGGGRAAGGERPKEMGKRPPTYVDAVELARHAGAEVRCADELTSLAKLEQLDELQPGAFSACTFTFGEQAHRRLQPAGHPRPHPERHRSRGGSPAAQARREDGGNDRRRQLLHLRCRRGAGGQLARRLPAAAAPAAPARRKARHGRAAIAEAYKVSEAMAAFRLRTTGVERQLGTSRDRR